MNRWTEADFDQRIADWLEDDPRRAPSQAVDTVMAAFPSIPQRRAVRVPWRFPRMTMPVRLAAAAVIGALVLGGAILFIGGGSRTLSTIPNPAASPTSVPTPVAGWHVTGAPSLDRGLGSVTARLNDGRVLVAGGEGPGGPTAAAEIYDPTRGTWSSTAKMGQARKYPVAVRLADGRVLVAGGTGSADALDSVEVFDPASGTWGFTGPMREPRSQAIAAVLADGRVLVAGGNQTTDDTMPATAEIYDPASRTWASTGDMAAWRAGPASAFRLADGRILITGGFVNLPGSSTSAELFDPRTGKWTATGQMSAERKDEQAGIALGDGRVMICGGHPTSCDLYDPAAGTFAATEAPPESSNDLVTLTQLPNGKVLLAAGGTNLDSPTTSPTTTGQLFDPVTGHWSIVPRSAMTELFVRSAALLPDGSVLVVGSSTADPGGTPSAEIYTP